MAGKAKKVKNQNPPKTIPKKTPIVEADQEDDVEIAFPKKKISPIFVVLQNAQLNESFHTKYVKEMQNVYSKIGFEEFNETFLIALKQFMTKSPDHPYANTALIFMAKYLTSYNDEDIHPLLLSIFNWLLETISTVPIIRFRICEFVNLILNSLGADAALDDRICDNILKYMLERLRDTSPMVRVQAVNALQRLQIPDNLNDPIVKIYSFHLNSDPSAAVRQAVITAIGRNYHTIPMIIDRFWDVDEKVRRHAYLQMCSYPVKAYKVVQRLTFLEQGLNDQTENVRKVVCNVLLPQWFESYKKDFLLFLSSLKLDSDTNDMDRFRKAAKNGLLELFKTQKDSELIPVLQLETEGEFKNCIPLNKLTVESSLYWWTLLEYFQDNEEKCDEADLVIPELSVFCNYIISYCNSIEKSAQTEKWKKINFQYILRTLTAILLRFDLGDEIGRQNLKTTFITLMNKEDIEEQTVENIVRCVENLIPMTNDRMQFFVDIIRDVVNANSTNNIIDLSDESISLLLSKDQDLKVKITSLKFKIMELKEQELEFKQRKEYDKTTKINEELNACNEEITKLIKKALIDSGRNETFSKLSSVLDAKTVTNEMIIRCLQMAFFAVCSRVVQSLTPNMAHLYKDFIRPQIESKQMLIRDWALKCGTSFSMLYPQLAKDTYKELNVQFFKNNNTKIWATSISATFQLIDMYGFEFFNEPDPETTAENIDTSKSKSKTSSRLLFNAHEYMDIDEDNIDGAGKSIKLMNLFDYFFETCEDVSIVSALVDGFCRIILRGHYTSKDLVSKLLLKFFNPTTDPFINQILSIFFETLMKTKKQECLQPALLPTLFVILEAKNENPLKEVKPETVLKFVINATMPSCSSPGLNIHNTIAMSFLDVMTDNCTNRDLLRIFSSVLRHLEVSDDPSLRNDLKSGLDKLIELPLDAKTLENIKLFKKSLDASDCQTFSSSAQAGRKTFEPIREDDSDAEPNADHIDEMDENGEEPTESNNNTNVIITECNKSTTTNVDSESVAVIESSNITTIATPTIATVTTSPATENAPTTYGMENSTRTRHLRKSMNVRTDSESSDVPIRQKIRKKNVTPRETGKKDAKADKGKGKGKGKGRRNQANEPDDDVESHSNVESENKSSNISLSDEIPPSPTIQTPRLIPRRLKVMCTPLLDSEIISGRRLKNTSVTTNSKTAAKMAENKNTSKKRKQDLSESLTEQNSKSRNSMETPAKGALNSSSNTSLGLSGGQRASKRLANRSNIEQLNKSSTTTTPTTQTTRANRKTKETPTRITNKSLEIPTRNSPRTISNRNSKTPIRTPTTTKQKLIETPSKTIAKTPKLTKTPTTIQSKTLDIPTEKTAKPTTPKATPKDVSKNASAKATRSQSEKRQNATKQTTKSQIPIAKSGHIQKAKKSNPLKSFEKIIETTDQLRKYGTRKAAVESNLQNNIITRKRQSTDVVVSPKQQSIIAKKTATTQRKTNEQNTTTTAAATAERKTATTTTMKVPAAGGSKLPISQSKSAPNFKSLVQATPTAPKTVQQYKTEMRPRRELRSKNN